MTSNNEGTLLLVLVGLRAQVPCIHEVLCWASVTAWHDKISTSTYLHYYRAMMVKLACNRHCLASPSSDVVIDDDLHVLGRLQLRARRVVPGLGPGVDVDDLSVPLILEQQPRLVVGYNLRRGVGERELLTQ